MVLSGTADHSDGDTLQCYRIFDDLQQKENTAGAIPSCRDDGLKIYPIENYE